MEKLKGKFIRCLYEKDMYKVFLFQSEEDEIVVNGNIGDVDYNFEYYIEGEYINHYKYGFQFKIENTNLILPENRKDTIDFLSSRYFKGINKNLAKKIVKKIGDKSIFELIKYPEILDEIDKLDETIKNEIIEKLKTINPKNEELYYLLKDSIESIGKIKIIDKYYQNNALEIIKENPFKLLEDFKFISFNQVDKIREKLNIDINDKTRVTYLLTHLVMKISFEKGSSYIGKDELFNEFKKTKINHSIFDEALENAVLKNKIIKISDIELYHHSQYNAEEYISEFIANFNDEIDINFDYLKEIKLFEKINGLTYSNNQIKAIEICLKNSLSIITGGAGSGKTTLIKLLKDIISNNFPFSNIVILTPTGRAAKRISEVGNIGAKTIHSFLKWNKEENVFFHNEENPIEVDTLIIDEFSMVDTYLLSNLLKGIKVKERICFIGDHNQLPSVAPGDLLKQFIDSDLLKKVILDTNYRQFEEGTIINLALDVLNNSIDFKNYNKDVVFIEQDIIENIDEIIDKLYINKYSLNNVQFISPIYKGDFGIDNLNNYIQNKVNPRQLNKAEYVSGKYIFRVNDRVIQNKNDYDYEVYNGDVGIIKNIEYIDKKYNFSIEFDDKVVNYGTDELKNISLAYCISVHKAQGGEYENVVFVISAEHHFYLYKELIYTAITRAKNKIIIFCNKNIFIKSICKLKEKRNSKIIEKINAKLNKI